MRYFADLDPEDEELHEFRKHLAAAFATKKRQRTVVHLHNWQRDQDPKVKEYEDQQMRKNTGKTQAEWEEFVEMMSDKAWDDCKVELRKVTESARAHTYFFSKQVVLGTENRIILAVNDLAVSVSLPPSSSTQCQKSVLYTLHSVKTCTIHSDTPYVVSFMNTRSPCLSRCSPSTSP